jgi:N-acetylmuramoyl-L-alanine amidase
MVLKVGNDMGHGVNTFPPAKGIFKNGIGYAEHTFNAKVGIKIREHLQRHGVHSMEAQAPNKPDVALNKRVSYYDAHRVNLVWSTHANYNSKKEVKGMGIFYWKGNAHGKEIAEYYIKLCREAGLPIWGNGVFESTDEPRDHWTNFAITRDTNATALLAENGFFSNDEDFNRIFNTPSYIDLVGEISAKSILYGLNVKWIPVEVVKPVVIPPKSEVKGASIVEEYKKDAQPSRSLAAKFKKAVELGITDGTFPQRGASREEVAVMIVNAIEHLEK